MSEIDEIKKEYELLNQQLSDPDSISDWPASTRHNFKDVGGSDAGWEKFEKISKRKNFLEKIIKKDEELKEVRQRIEENKSIISVGEDKELVSLAEAELNELSNREKKLEKEIEGLKKGEGEEKPQAVIIEIRAGTGGEEAALFVTALFRMYSKYAKSRDWRQKILDSRITELGGYKEVIFELKDGNVFSQMKYEGGVHRVQRIPETEKSGRIHTSTVSVAVLVKPKKAEIKIRPDELKVDVYKSSGPGGQYVNKRETAVRITHLPSGIVVSSQTERNLLQNKENAMVILEAKLLERKQIEEKERISGKRKAQIGWAKRAEKIRTYNFPQDRITDHRIKKSWKEIEEILNGKLDPIIEALRKSPQEG